MTEDDRIKTIVRRMADDVERFEGDGRALNNLSYSLKANLALLAESGADLAWVEELLGFRNEIEVINAFYIESGRTRLNDEEQCQLEEVMGELREALRERHGAVDMGG